MGKEEIRSYRTRQWAEFDPRVEPLTITEGDGGKIHVRVHQVVKSLQGDVLSDSEVLHVFTMKIGLIAAMDLGDEAGATAGPSAAFAHRSSLASRSGAREAGTSFGRALTPAINLLHIDV